MIQHLEAEIAPGIWHPIAMFTSQRVVDAVNQEYGREVLLTVRIYCSPIPFPTTPEMVCFMTGLRK